MDAALGGSGDRRYLLVGLAGARYAEAGDHLPQLLPSGDVADADLTQLGEVQERQALGEKLAVDDALAKPRDDPEADPAGELVKRGADPAQVMRIDMLQAV